ncbi:thioredoxin domain-containing protein [Zhouia spongiae]|uniref:Thioredoxin domain-containing protein n=1 Tax=Zhouia spongiae TaxID=2202721 RepID=A0ABY3YNS2_9FLAO|nr:thioredoxin domain-containing protein [Zhouia spongiae]UNY99189.1 thioredoxin domain-containing protein [Zhouia spongiae]
MRHCLAFIFLFLFCDISLTAQKSNHLKNASSPYLLAHKDNPVNWYPWNEIALNKALKEDKLLVISIGYSACHWCHVMEKESFSDIEVAEEMNANFISIKIDREERQDIDKIYMEACRLLNEDCGWPLNIIALPDGKPVYATTYQTKSNWLKILKYASENYRLKPTTFKSLGASIQKEIEKSTETDTLELKAINTEILRKSIDKWLEDMDWEYGGYKGAEKFPLPQSFSSLLDAYFYITDEKIIHAVTLTLDHILNGGVYDHIDGGFSRYTTDYRWRHPHFEKMLYDNAQLISLYTKAYSITKNEQYKYIVYQSIQFLLTNMTTEEGLFASSLNADSKSGEGDYYTWTYKELQEVLGDDLNYFNRVFDVSETGNWLYGKNVLYKKQSNHIDEEKIKECISKLKKRRSLRDAPERDDKTLTDWNALAIISLTDAYRVFGESQWLAEAIKRANTLNQKVWKKNTLYHSYINNSASIKGFLNDYAYLIKAYLNIYEATLDKNWIDRAQKIHKAFEDNFLQNGFYLSHFEPKTETTLFTSKITIDDDVTPSGNAIMAINYYMLGTYTGNSDFIKKSRKMTNASIESFTTDHRFYASWFKPLIWSISAPYQIAILGEDAISKSRELDRTFLPNKILIGSINKENLPLLKEKLVTGQTTIYVCKNGYCKLPTTNIPIVLKQIND